ncbi:hypothetical protein Tco_0594210 [Tanacetum coccineum]
MLIGKMEKNKSYDKADYKIELYDALIKSYETNRDLFDSYGEVFSLKRSRDDKVKDQDPSAGSDRGTKRRKSSKEAESYKDSRSKEKNSSSTSKDASYSQHKPSGKSAHAEEPSHTIDDSGVQQNQDFNTELEYHLEECSKATTERLDWHNPEGKLYPFDLSKPLPLIPDHQDRQVIHQDFFINNNLEYLKGGDLSRCPMKKLSNLTIDERYDFNVALRMFTRHIVIQRRVEDLQLAVESYQKKLNLTKPDSYRSDVRNRTTYTSYSDPHEMIYVDQFDRKRMMRTDELYKFSDGTLNDVRTALHDIYS